MTVINKSSIINQGDHFEENIQKLSITKEELDRRWSKNTTNHHLIRKFSDLHKSISPSKIENNETESHHTNVIKRNSLSINVSKLEYMKESDSQNINHNQDAEENYENSSTKSRSNNIPQNVISFSLFYLVCRTVWGHHRKTTSITKVWTTIKAGLAQPTKIR